VTTIYVTHDQVEAMTMGDRVAVMRRGELQQVASPQELYDNPVNLFVGGFIGSPAMNVVEATIERVNGGLALKTGEQSIAIGDEVLENRPALKAYEGREVVLGIRPEDLEDAAISTDTPADQRMRGRVDLREALGSEIMVHFTIEAPPAVTEDVRELARDIGDESAVEAKVEASHTTVVGRFSPRTEVRPGDVIEVAVDTRSLHFFDRDTGMGIYKEQDSTKGAGT
jgi:multiple sugar transport system ATP-binding protein